MYGGLFIDLRALLVNGRGNALLYACHHPVADSDFSTNAKRHPISASVSPQPDPPRPVPTRFPALANQVASSTPVLLS